MDSNPVTKTVTSNVPVTETTFITPIFNKINDIYLKKSYLERYVQTKEAEIKSIKNYLLKNRDIFS